MSRQRFLITGGAGFIGSALAGSLLEKGFEVLIMDLPHKIAVLPKRWRSVALAGDIRDRSAYVPLGDRSIDVVLHLAAQTSARISHEDPERDVDTNAKGTMLLVDWCREHGVKRVVYASSMAVYGEPPCPAISESLLPNPVSYYGVSKLAGENYIRANGRLGLSYTIFRLFNVYGPGQDMENLKQGMVSIYLAYVAKGQDVPVTGELDRFRDFIYVDDVVDAWLRTIDDKRTYGKIYNLGTGRKTTVRELLDIIIRTCGYDPLTYPVQVVGSHAGDIHGNVSDSSLFSQETGWRPKTELNEGVNRMVAWYRNVLQTGGRT